MLDGYQNIFLVVLSLTLAFCFLTVLNRVWAPSKRRTHNDVIGWQLAIIGTVYAVLIGFMLYAVWGNFQTADANADDEANYLTNLFRTAEGLPAAQRDAIQQLAQQYAHVMVTEEWPAMNEQKSNPAGHLIIQQLWAAVLGINVNGVTQQVVLNQSLSELRALTRHRRVRELESESGLPDILWAVLISGGIITIASSCLIGSENIALHMILIFSLTLLISLALVAIADIDRPFQGSVHVGSHAFVRAADTMAEFHNHVP